MKKEFKVIADLLPNNTRVLDVGCGEAQFYPYVKKKEYLGLDIDDIKIKNNFFIFFLLNELVNLLFTLFKLKSIN